MHRRERAEELLHGGAERFVGRVLVGEHGVAARLGNGDGAQDRTHGRPAHVGHVGVPVDPSLRWRLGSGLGHELPGQRVVDSEDLGVLLGAADHRVALRRLAEPQCEREVLLRGEVLTGE